MGSRPSECLRQPRAAAAAAPAARAAAPAVPVARPARAATAPAARRPAPAARVPTRDRRAPRLPDGRGRSPTSRSTAVPRADLRSAVSTRVADTAGLTAPTFSTSTGALVIDYATGMPTTMYPYVGIGVPLRRLRERIGLHRRQVQHQRHAERRLHDPVFGHRQGAPSTVANMGTCAAAPTATRRPRRFTLPSTATDVMIAVRGPGERRHGSRSCGPRSDQAHRRPVAGQPGRRRRPATPEWVARVRSRSTTSRSTRRSPREPFSALDGNGRTRAPAVDPCVICVPDCGLRSIRMRIRTAAGRSRSAVEQRRRADQRGAARSAASDDDDDDVTNSIAEVIASAPAGRERDDRADARLIGGCWPDSVQ